MYLIQCDGCGTTATADCGCKVLGHDPSVAGAHHPACRMADPDGLVVCPPTSACCHADHTGEPDRRGHAVLACPVDHAGHACPNPAGCKLWEAVKAHWAATLSHQQQAFDAGHHEALRDAVAVPEVPDDCPGGHHGLGVRGCRVCRSVSITATGPAATLVRMP